MQQTHFPSPDAEPERYAGRPLLIVLENFVLACIGELGPDKEAMVRSVVQGAFGSGDDWGAAVRQKLRFEPTIDSAFRRMWEQNQRIAKEQNQVLLPVQFAKMVVDQNFAHLF